MLEMVSRNIDHIGVRIHQGFPVVDRLPQMAATLHPKRDTQDVWRVQASSRAEKDSTEVGIRLVEDGDSIRAPVVQRTKTSVCCNGRFIKDVLSPLPAPLHVT